MNASKNYHFHSRVLKSGIKAGAMAATLSVGIFGLGIIVHGAAQAAENPFAHLTGSWAGQGKITAQASAVGFNASLSIATRGNSQSVSIRSPGSEISEVSISMARAGR